MTLNKQLLYVSLLLLSLPWAGCQFLHEVDSIMHSGQEQTLMASTEAIATVFSQQPELLYPHSGAREVEREPTQSISRSGEAIPPIYFHPLPAPVWIDGYDEGWDTIPPIDYHHPGQPGQKVSYRAGIVDQQLFLLFDITDTDIIYNNPANSLIDDGDRLIITTGKGRAYSFTSAAPGKIIARYHHRSQGLGPKVDSEYSESKITAHWQDTAQGYTVEISLPATLVAGRLGFYVIDQDSIDQDRDTEFGYGQLLIDQYRLNQHAVDQHAIDQRAIKKPPLFIYQPAALEQQLTIFARSGQRLKIIDTHFWMLSQSGDIEQSQPLSGHWLMRKLYRALLDSQPDTNPEYSNAANHSTRKEVIEALQGSASNAWYRDVSRPNYYILASAAPVYDNGNIVGVIVAEQSSEQLAALSDNAFNRLLLLSLGAISVVALGLLGYASWLSWRIRRLSRAATAMINDDGKLVADFPQSRAADEVGELTRNYGQLLCRIRDYTEYLQTLSRKLSHELRTPLAIIHSSLDNLHNQPLNQQSSVYQQRAKEGALRLGNILSAMSEASRVEESIHHAEPEKVNILALLTGITQAYRDLYQDHRISLEYDDSMSSVGHTITAVPDLLVQMLDKLVDNAVSFCPKGGCITFVCCHHGSDISLSIANDGPLLPDKMRSQLFDNMVSLRQQEQNTPHLGLGLHIVNLIVKCHNGQISAANRNDNNGVIFTVSLPQ